MTNLQQRVAAVIARSVAQEWHGSDGYRALDHLAHRLADEIQVQPEDRADFFRAAGVES